MSTWLESGRSAIQEALAAAFDKIDENARTEIQGRHRKDSELQGELQRLKARAAEVDRLRQENNSLREEIQLSRQAQRGREPKPPITRKVLGELSPNKPLNPQPAKPQVHEVNATSGLQKKYNKLTAKYKALEKSRDEYKSKLRKRVEEIDRWAKSLDSRDRLIGSLRKKLELVQSRLGADGSLETRPNGTDHREPADDENLDVDVPVPERPSPNPSFEQPVGAVPYTTAPSTTSTRAGSEPTLRPVVPSHPCEDTTEGSTDEDGCVDDNIELPRLPEPRGDETRVAIKAVPSSDGPVFVSERPVRKRKHDREEDEPEDKRLQRIKSEHSSSGPECLGEAHTFAPTESLDFEEEAHIPTPRKRRGQSHDRLQDQDTGAERTTGPGLPDTVRRGISVPSGRPRAPAQGPGPGLTPRTHQASAILDVLERQPRPATPRNRQPYKSRNVFHLDVAVRSLAEDEDAGLDIFQRPVARGRLDALLNSPSARTPMPLIRPRLARVQDPRLALADDGEDLLKVPAPRELPHGKKSPNKEATAVLLAQQSTADTPSPKTAVGRGRPPKRPSILREDMPGGRMADREKTPLRQKPMDKLRPEDFKPNPKHNDGLTYVYDEVNRGKSAAERAALSGCTDPNCCGKTFRSFAEAQRSTIGPSVATRAEDIKLLEDYLGDEAYRLGTMAREEKEETWLQAKTWELANKFGRHRQRYARVPSPPGFWTVELPNTQERAEERRQAEEIQKALVHDRYREAMRAGGRWLFRDE